jgi:putative redox protein
MVELDIVYEGDLHCRLTHGPSGSVITTDAPKDNEGRGEAFSPTDLVGAALGSCMVTIMGIAARRHGIDIAGTKVHVVKEMHTGPQRRIRRLETTITLPRALADKERAMLENAAKACPVHRSLHPDVEAPIRFVYPPS